MPEQIVIDSDIIIDALHADAQAIATLHEIESRAVAAIRVVTEMELVVGIRNKNEQRTLDNFLSHFQILPLTEQISQKAIELLRRYRLSHGLLIQDSLIAATAISLDLQFVTKNVREYRFISELKLLSYPNPVLTQGKKP